MESPDHARRFRALFGRESETAACRHWPGSRSCGDRPLCDGKVWATSEFGRDRAQCAAPGSGSGCAAPAALAGRKRNGTNLFCEDEELIGALEGRDAVEPRNSIEMTGNGGRPSSPFERLAPTSCDGVAMHERADSRIRRRGHAKHRTGHTIMFVTPRPRGDVGSSRNRAAGYRQTVKPKALRERRRLIGG